jgi:hypothetical protein
VLPRLGCRSSGGGTPPPRRNLKAKRLAQRVAATRTGPETTEAAQRQEELRACSPVFGLANWPRLATTWADRSEDCGLTKIRDARSRATDPAALAMISVSWLLASTTSRYWCGNRDRVFDGTWFTTDLVCAA